MAVGRYFIVVDDIWDKQTWEVIKIAFLESNSRSRIITTTRNFIVSEEIGEVYRMEKLPESQSRELLYTRTFGVEEKWPDNDDLDVVAQKILHRCDGVPLAIITIASLLARKQTEEWSDVYDSVSFGQEDDTQLNNMKKILSFSYYDLPCHLRTCMLYLSVFPEDYSVHRDSLIWMWIAEGLVQIQEGEEPFEVGRSYYLELINRGMIQPVKDYGYFYANCRVHDMVLHMIRDLSREENFLVMQDSKKQGPQGNIVRRLALHKAGPIPVANDVGMQKVRSLHVISFGGDNILPPVSGFKYLRVLNLESCRPLQGDYLDTEHLGKLLHLRYLGLQWTPLRDLHGDIGNLKFLVTLMLNGTGIEELPRSVEQLTKLLCLRADWEKTRVPDWIGELTSLVELQMYFADGSVKELGKLKDLRVLNTQITLQDDGQVREFLLALSNLQKLECMTIGTSNRFVCKDAIMQPSFVVLCCTNLSDLLLDTLQFSRLPKWINPQALPNLCTLALNLSVLYQQDMEILGAFQKLSLLHLNLLDYLSSQKISVSGDGKFQNLKRFNVTGLYHLAFVPGAMPRLEQIGLNFRLGLIKDDYRLGVHTTVGNLTALKVFTAGIDCTYCLPEEVEELDTELIHALRIHPNRPTIYIKMNRPILTSSPDPIFKQVHLYKRAQRLKSQVTHLSQVYDAMRQEAVEMDEMKTDLNLSDDTKNKVQEFHQQLGHLVHNLRPLGDDTPVNDYGDLNRAMESIAAMALAQDALTIAYPWFAAVLDELRYAFSLQGAMLMPQVINLYICVLDVKADSCLDIGLIGKKISSLKGIKAHIMCQGCFPTEVEEVEAELSHAVHTHHPNDPPTLDIIRYGEDKMVVNSDSDSQMMLERQKYRARRLHGRIKSQEELCNALWPEADELKNNMNLNDDAKQKEQRFREHFKATIRHVNNKLLRVYENMPDRDLNRLTEDIADMEWALKILTDEYPRLAAMLEELKTASLSSQKKDDDEMADSLTEEVSATASLSDTEAGGEVVEEAVVSLSSLSV